jgi:predicted peptidase
LRFLCGFARNCYFSQSRKVRKTFPLGFTHSRFAIIERVKATPHEDRARFLTRSVNVGGRSYSYQVYVPTSLQGRRDAPAVLFLHGIGQRGEGGFIPAAGGVSEIAKFYLERMPAIVVMPQCRKDRYWPDEDMQKMAVAALDDATAEFAADPRRLYLVGVSMGGYGAWQLAANYPEKFAAAIPVCGGSPLRSGDRFTPIASKVRRMPVWVFHGAADRIVPVSESRSMVKALEAVKGNVKYSEYAGVGHDVWFNVLAEPDLWPWLLSQRLNDC